VIALLDFPQKPNLPPWGKEILRKRDNILPSCIGEKHEEGTFYGGFYLSYGQKNERERV
jgi:hypothetical protein